LKNNQNGVFFTDLQRNEHELWHAGNDGTGSGLDADTLDGQHASAFALASASNISDSTLLSKIKNVDGSGSGLDADTLDGKQLSTIEAEYQTAIDNAVSALVNAAPGALDTLNELAAALGDDPNFATTVTNSLATKLNASAYTAADVKAKLLTVDGSGSGIDADMLDGLHQSSFARASHTHSISDISGYSPGVSLSSLKTVSYMAKEYDWVLLSTALTKVPDNGLVCRAYFSGASLSRTCTIYYRTYS
jgi:hypothetical protein